MGDLSYTLNGSEVLRVTDQKVVATIGADGELKQTAPRFKVLLPEIKERLIGRAMAPGASTEPTYGELGDRTPEVLAYRRKHWNEQQFTAHYGERVTYKGGAE